MRYILDRLCQELSGKGLCLVKECRCDMKVSCLMMRLVPQLNTVATYHQYNSGTAKDSCKSFIQFFREVKLFNGAIDDSCSVRMTFVLNALQHITDTRIADADRLGT
jgi:hypothetical protein